MSETSIMKDIQLAFTNFGARLFRNNVGKVWTAHKPQLIKKKTHIEVGPGDVVLRNARRLNVGLGLGTSDLIGWTRMEIKQEHVGAQAAIFTAVEVKSKYGRATKEQVNFVKIVKDCGGFSGIAKSVEDAVEIVHGF